MVPAVIRRFLTFRPYGDGLDHTLHVLKDVREASLDKADEIAHQGGRVEQVTIGVPAELIDLMVMQLEHAKNFRNLIYRHNHQMRVIIFWLTVIAFVNAALQIVPYFL